MFPEAARVFFHTSKYFVTWIPYSVACALVNYSFHPPSAHSAVYSAVGSCYWLSTAATRRAPSGASGLG